MSNKGKVFTHNDLPKRRPDKLTTEKANAWCKYQTERNKIVAYDGETPLITEELEQRAVNKLSPKARRVAGSLLFLDVETRKEVLKAFDKSGRLVLPFKMV